jgi:acyl carrier protein
VKALDDLLRESIAEICGLDAAQLRPEATLESLGVDSLASAEVLVDLEIRLGRQLPAGTLRRLEHAHTLADLSALLAGAFGPDATGQGSPLDATPGPALSTP